MQDEDIEGEGHQAKRLRISSDTFQDTIGNEELSLFGSTPNNSDSAQVASSALVRVFKNFPLRFIFFKKLQ